MTTFHWAELKHQREPWTWAEPWTWESKEVTTYGILLHPTSEHNYEAWDHSKSNHYHTRNSFTKSQGITNFSYLGIFPE